MEKLKLGGTIILEFRYKFFDKEEATYWLKNKSNLTDHYLKNITAIDVFGSCTTVQFNSTVNCFDAMQNIDCQEFDFTSLGGCLVKNAVIRINLCNNLNMELTVLKLLQISKFDEDELEEKCADSVIVLRVDRIKVQDICTGDLAVLLFCKNYSEIHNIMDSLGFIQLVLILLLFFQT